MIWPNPAVRQVEINVRLELLILSLLRGPVAVPSNFRAAFTLPVFARALKAAGADDLAIALPVGAPAWNVTNASRSAVADWAGLKGGEIVEIVGRSADSYRAQEKRRLKVFLPR